MPPGRNLTAGWAVSPCVSVRVVLPRSRLARFIWMVVSHGRELDQSIPTGRSASTASCGTPASRSSGSTHSSHTWAALSLQAGVELWAVADLAGQSKVSVTYRVYRHAIRSGLRDASDRLSGLLFQDPLVSNPLADR